MKQKRVAMISYHTNPIYATSGKQTGGMNVYVLELAKKMSEKGVCIDIFTRSHTKKRLIITEISKYARIIQLGAGPSTPIVKKKLPTYIADFVVSMNKFIEKQAVKYDLIHAHYYMSGLVAVDFIKKSHYIPLVVNFHTLALMKNLVARNTHEKENQKRIENECAISRHASKIIALSQSDKQYMQYLYDVPDEKLVVIPPGVDTNIFHPQIKDEARDKIGFSKNSKIILFVGRIEPLKGIDTLLYTVKILLSQNPSLKKSLQLIIIGGDISQKKSLWSKEMRKLVTLKNTLNIATSVSFVGYKSRVELSTYYAASDVLVMPSHYETFGIVALEAMASGLPTIATSVSGISSMLDKSTPYFQLPSNSPLDVAKTIESLFSNYKEYKSITHELSQKAQTLTWDHVADSVLQVYESLW